MDFGDSTVVSTVNDLTVASNLEPHPSALLFTKKRCSSGNHTCHVGTVGAPVLFQFTATVRQACHIL